MTQIKWTNAAGGDFSTAADWSTDTVPGTSDDAILQALSMAYTVTTSASPTVNSIQLAATTTLSITGGTFTATSGTGSGVNNGTILINDNTTFNAGGTIAGTGTILINGVNNDNTNFILGSNTTLSGGGLVSLKVGNGTNRIYGATASIVLNNASDTIAGAGQLGLGQMILQNGAAGIINANSSNNQLVLNVAGANATNAGLIEATGVGGLRILNSTVTQTGTGTIKAIGTSVAVNLDTGVIIGGTLATANGGVIESVNSGELSGLTINTGAQIYALDNTSLLLDGTITNKGTITINGTSNDNTNLILNTPTVTLTGAGMVTLEGNNGTNRIYSNSTSTIAQLVNINNTIQGAGQIGIGQLGIDNRVAGIIDASGPVGLTIQANSFTNEGLVESTTGALGINATTITNTGTIAALGNGASVDLYDSSDVIGGTLKTTGTGVIESSNNATLDGSTKTGAINITTGGAILINDNTSLDVLGTINNAGTITLNGVSNDSTDLIVNSATVTLTGGGVVQLEPNNGSNRIYGSATTNLLVNVNNIIEGSGQLGANQADGAFDNQAHGIIDANSANVGMTINASSFTNEGLIESTATTGLTISSTITNTSTIAAFGTVASYIVLNDSATIIGGLLETSATGLIYVQNGTFDGTGTGGITLTAGSNVQVSDDTSLTLDGTLNNDGIITINGVGNDSTNFIFNTATTTLTGGGVVQLEPNNGSNRIYGSAATNLLVNVNNIIEGAGQLGANEADGAFDNQANGVIDANSANVGMTINASSFTNEGLIESTATTGLTISSTISNTGTIAAFGTVASYIVLNNSATIIGGKLETSPTSLIYVQNGTFDGTGTGGITLTAGSNVQVSDDTSLTLDGTLNNDGTITINGVNNDSTNLIYNTATTTLTGGGVVQLEPNNGSNRIYGSVSTNLLVNVNNLIEGAGQIGANQGSIDNQAAGVIDANSASVGITIDATSFTNEGLIESTATSGLTIESTITNTGTIAALGAVASYILLNDSATIVGGTLKVSPTGTFYVQGGTFDGTGTGGITLTAGSNVQVSDNNSLTIDGTLNNDGTITINGVSNDDTNLIFNTATTTLTGGGVVQLEPGNGTNRIYGSVSSDVLVNVNNTIQGAGQIGANQGSFDNRAAGVIDANGSGPGITIQATNFTNEGLIESTTTAGLAISSNITNTGTIEAVGTAASVITLNNYASIIGGTVKTSATGLISVVNGTFDGSTTGHPLTLTAGSNVLVNDNTTLYLAGTISNGGTITINGVSNDNTNLIINTPTVTLTGGGVVQLEPNNGTNRIYGAATTDKLVNVNNTIQGAGQIGAGQLTLDNQAAGVIDANTSIGLNISLGSTFTNEGLAEASLGGTLLIQNATLTNTGTIAALSDSAVNLASSTVLTNLASTGTLTSGTYESISAGGTHTSSFTFGSGPAIKADNANLVLSGAGSSIVSGPSATALAASLASVGAHGTLSVLNGASFAGAGPLADNGNIVLSGSLTATTVTVGAAGTLTGSGGTGTLSLTKLTNKGVVQASNGTLTLVKGSLTNTGTVQALAGGTLGIVLPGKTTNLVTGTLTGGSWSAIGNGATLSIGSGTITTDAAVLTLSGIGSVIKSAGSGKTLESTLTTITAAGQLNVLGGRSFASTAAAGLTDNGTLTLGGGTLSATSLTIASGATLTGNGSVTTAVADSGLLIASAGTLTLTKLASGTGALQAASGATLNASAGYTVGSVTVASGGTLVGAGSATGAIGIAGSLLLQGGTLSGASISVSTATGVLGGFGTVAQDVANTGTIDANGGTLTLAAGESGGVLKVEAGASLVSTASTVAATSLTIAAGGSFIGLGSVTGATSDAGSLTASGALTLATATGAGSATIASGATLAVGGALVFGGGVTFASGSETLSLGQVTGDTSVLSGFASGDTIDLQNSTVTSVKYSAGTLTLLNGTTTLGTLSFAGSYTVKNFHLQSDGHSGTDIVYAATSAVGPFATSPLADLNHAVAAAAIQPKAAPAASLAHDTAYAGGRLPEFSLAAHIGDLLMHQS